MRTHVSAGGQVLLPCLHGAAPTGSASSSSGKPLGPGGGEVEETPGQAAGDALRDHGSDRACCCCCCCSCASRCCCGCACCCCCCYCCACCTCCACCACCAAVSNAHAAAAADGLQRRGYSGVTSQGGGLGGHGAISGLCHRAVAPPRQLLAGATNLHALAKSNQEDRGARIDG